MMLQSRKSLGCPSLKVSILTFFGIALEEIDCIFMRVDLLIDIFFDEVGRLEFAEVVHPLFVIFSQCGDWRTLDLAAVDQCLQFRRGLLVIGDHLLCELLDRIVAFLKCKLIHCVDLHDLSFHHGHAVIERAIASGTPVCVKFARDEKSWKVSVTVDDAVEQKASDYSHGSIGVDLNAGHVSIAHVDASGNPVESFDIPCVTYGRSSDQAKDSIRQAAAQIADLAERLGVPIVSEKLDFSKKKATLKDSSDPRY